VISYTRRYVEHGLGVGYDLLVIQNPFARTPIPHALLDAPGVRQTVLHDNGNRSYYTIEP
jgi:hypothetical protein